MQRRVHPDNHFATSPPKILIDKHLKRLNSPSQNGASVTQVSCCGAPMYLPILAALAALVTTVATAPGVRHVLHEKRDTLAPRWTLGKRVPSLSRMPMRIGLTQRNLEGAERALLDV